MYKTYLLSALVLFFSTEIYAGLPVIEVNSALDEVSDLTAEGMGLVSSTAELFNELEWSTTKLDEINDTLEAIDSLERLMRDT